MQHSPLELPLDTRAGWPADMRVLLDRYPREVWGRHPNLDELARFWLQRHDMFRELGAMLETVTADFREGRLAVPEFHRVFAPRLQFFLSQLDAHHQIEDHHYFPTFRAVDDRLARGFDVLENDHAALHTDIVASVDAANALLRVLGGDADMRSRAADRYAEVGTRLLSGLNRHLGDEEDLIVPLILERGGGL